LYVIAPYGRRSTVATFVWEKPPVQAIAAASETFKISVHCRIPESPFYPWRSKFFDGKAGPLRDHAGDPFRAEEGGRREKRFASVSAFDPELLHIAGAAPLDG
jgi:hypothetical protein